MAKTIKDLIDKGTTDSLEAALSKVKALRGLLNELDPIEPETNLSRQFQLRIVPSVFICAAGSLGAKNLTAISSRRA